jgi:ferric-dicitrate binding protein FerR (iron transport regulator)
MTVTSQPTDQPTGQFITDQKTLEKLFRQHYSRLLGVAKKHLGDAAAPAAPRVVSKAFHLAWQDRKRFHSFDELDAFLGAQIHHQATREISRRAGLHRMDHHEGLGGGAHAKHEMHEMSVDEAWDRLEHTLQGGAPEAYKARASAARHEAAAHVKDLGKERSWMPLIVVGLIGLAIAVAGMLYVNKAGEERRIASALSGPEVRHTEMGTSQHANVTLDDGTVARLAPETKLTVPNRFNRGIRAVKLEGAGSFNVTAALDKPFEVRAGDVAIIARGTVFTVRRYRDEDNVVVNVKEGNVDVRFAEAVRNVPQGMSLLVAKDGSMRVPSAEELQEATTWVDGQVTMAGRTLRYVLPQLKRWYGLDIKVPNTALLDRPVFVSAATNSQREAITSVEKSAGVKFTYIGENMVFEDTVPSKAAPRSTKRR